MAYVPGFDCDVFLSYAHGDNETNWVSFFHERLKSRLREFLGVQPAIWWDERQLGGDSDFTEEIRLRIASSAVVIAVVSPSYLASRFCRLERQAFQHAAESQGGLKVGTSFRIVKAVKTPKEGNAHRDFLKDALGFEFFRQIGDRDFDDFVPGEREFDDEVSRLARRLRDLLGEMRRLRQSIYIAEPPPELEPTWEMVRRELSANGYGVVPVDRLDEFFAPEALVAEMRPAILTVHLLGAGYHEFSVRQARLACELQKPAVIWVAPDAMRDDRQRQFIADHAGFSKSGIRYSLLTNHRDWQLSQMILDELKPRREIPLATAANGGAASIYLICDRKDPDESNMAARLRDDIIGREKMRVFLPEIDRDPSTVDQAHWKNLSMCDGVLLYWGRAGKEWFFENFGDVDRASRRVRPGKPFVSEAIVLGKPDDPAKMSVTAPLVVRDFSEPSIDRLEPFLAPLRRASGATGN